MELTQTVQEIADVIGRERALYLIGQLPTTRVESRQYNKVLLYVPKSLAMDHILVKILGWNDASKLAKVFAGELIQVSNCEYIYRAFLHRSIKQLTKEGMSAKAVAELFGVSERTVIRHSDDKPKKELSAANDNTPKTFPNRATA